MAQALPHDLRMLNQEFDFLLEVDVLSLEPLFEFLDLLEVLFELVLPFPCVR